MQNEITKVDKLLDENGNLKHKGFSKQMLLEYSRNDIKAPKWRIKEWDYYLIYNDNYGIALTFDDNGYMGLFGASVLDFKNSWENTKNLLTLMPLGKYNLPNTSKTGDAFYKDKNLDVGFVINKDNTRTLKFKMEKFLNKKPFECEFTLSHEPKENICIATPFEKDKHFYYNQKIVGFKAQGYVKFDDKQIDFSSDDTVALLDWGRGVWTYKNTWYWGAGSGYVDGHSVAFNIGYGFGDTSCATENMIFYDGIAHKLEDVTFNIPVNDKGQDDYLKPWTFTSSDGRFEMNFEPVLDRYCNTDVLIIASKQHQVFGKFSGTMVLDDGTKVKIKNFLGFAEKVMNKW